MRYREHRSLVDCNLRPRPGVTIEDVSSILTEEGWLQGWLQLVEIDKSRVSVA